MLVQVMAPPDDTEALPADRWICVAGEETPPGIDVVYHPAAVQLADGSWACPDCGENSGAQREQAVTVQ